MPRIIVQTEGTQQHAPAFTLSERLVPTEGRTEYYLDQLLERIGWALLDAEDLEATNATETVAAASHRRQRLVNPRRGATSARSSRGRGRAPALRSAR
jgi:hypothetical protein